jgi:hypothetical protein
MATEAQAAVLNLTDAYDQIERGDFVTLVYADGVNTDVKVDGMAWLSGHHKPLQIVSSRGRRYALGNNDRVVRKERGF